MATQIKKVINEFLKKQKKEIDREIILKKYIKEIVGDETMEYIDVSRIEKDNLVIYTNTPMVKYQLNLLRTKILKKIQSKHPEVRKINIKIKGA
ncbi:MAG: DciA family protein [Candidatus Omnitrophota bacterium]